MTTGTREQWLASRLELLERERNQLGWTDDFLSVRRLIGK